MPKTTISIEVDPNKMFDAVQAMDGDLSTVGERLAGILLTGKAGMIEAVGLAVYGIEVTEISQKNDFSDFNTES